MSLFLGLRLLEESRRPSTGRVGRNRDPPRGHTTVEEYDGSGQLVRYHLNGTQYIDERVATYDAATGKFLYYIHKENWSVAGIAYSDGTYDALVYSPGGDFTGNAPTRDWHGDAGTPDGDVDEDDFAILQSCFTGPGVAVAAGCEETDLDRDNDVDAEDYSLFQICMSGPGVAPPAGCVTDLPKSRLFLMHGLALDVIPEGPMLLNARARFYDPEHGRWLQRDPKGYVDGPNLYEAFKGNPLAHIDPFGLMDPSEVITPEEADLIAEWERKVYYGVRDVYYGVGRWIYSLHEPADTMYSVAAEGLFVMRHGGEGDLEAWFMCRTGSAVTSVANQITDTVKFRYIQLGSWPDAVTATIADPLVGPLANWWDGETEFRQPYDLEDFTADATPVVVAYGLVRLPGVYRSIRRTVTARTAFEESMALLDEQIGRTVVPNPSSSSVGPMNELAEQLRLRIRQLELSPNVETTLPNMAEGLGAARYEKYVGRTMTRSLEQGADIVDPGIGPVSLKGPLVDSATGRLLSITDEMVDGLADSVVKDALFKTYTRRVVVDTLGMTEGQIARLVQRIRAAVPAGEKAKEVFILH